MIKPLITSIVAVLTLTHLAPAAEPIPLRAGPISMLFDADNAFLRYLRVGPHEILRGINAPVRDQNWSTVAPKVSNLQVNQGDDHFHVTFDVHCAQAEIDFRWHGSISGTADGVIELTFDGLSHSTFLRNRIGFCVLHGPSAAGQTWLLETVDGNTSQGRFPVHISPHQPAKNLRAITHQLAPGIRARVEFEGDVFEMEDQRNWTDASFKTYCTPLAIPYPVEVKSGTRISQKVTIRVLGELPKELPSEAQPIVLTLRDRHTALPRLGVQVSREVDGLTDGQVERLKALQLDHLRVDLALSNPDFVKDLRRATEQAHALGVSLQIGLTLGESPAFSTLVSEVHRLHPPVTYWLVTGGNPADFRESLRHLKGLADGAKLGVTRITNFVDLNRARPEADAVEAVGFAINPQVHAFDNASMIETLPIHADVVNSTRQFVGDRPLIIGPITLRPQLVNGIAPLGGPPPGALPTYVDARQVSSFAAVWTLGSLKYLAEAGARSATFYETVGWNGLMDIDDVVARPSAYPSQPGEVFPVYQLLKMVGEFAGGQVQQLDSSDPLSVVALALKNAKQSQWFIGNLTDRTQTVTLAGSDERIELPPHALQRIDR